MNTVGIKEDIEKETKSYYETLKKRLQDIRRTARQDTGVAQRCAVAP